MTNYYIYPGRFQPLHIGHFELIKTILERIEYLYIAIIIKEYSYENPFTYIERMEFLTKTLSANNLIHRCSIIPLFAPDIFKWKINNCFFPKRRIWCFPDDNFNKISDYKKCDELVEVFQRKNKNICASVIRDLITKDLEWANYIDEVVYNHIIAINGVDRIKELYNNGVFKNESSNNFRNP